MSLSQERDRRNTASYKAFKKTPFVRTIHTIFAPLVQEAHEEEPAFNIPPYFDNLLRLQLREFIKPFCYWVGIYEVLYEGTVQMFYDCNTWMDLDFLAFQVEWCVIFTCELPTELWSGGDQTLKK